MTFTQSSERFWTCLSTFILHRFQTARLNRQRSSQGIFLAKWSCLVPFLHSFYSVSLSSQKFLRSSSTLWVCRHGRLNTCVGCPPKVAHITYTVLVETLNHAQSTAKSNRCASTACLGCSPKVAAQNTCERKISDSLLDTASKFALFSVSGLKDKKVDKKSKPTWKLKYANSILETFFGSFFWDTV